MKVKRLKAKARVLARRALGTGAVRHQRIILSSVVGIFALLGIGMLVSSNAATFAVAAEAESGTVAGNAAKNANVSGASNNSVVIFGASTPTPPTPPGPPPPPPGGGTQTLGVGGVAAPPGALVSSSDQGPLKITSGGTASNPKVYDGAGHKVGRIDILADNVVVQNFHIDANNQYAVYIEGNNITAQNNDIKNVHAPGDLNAFTFHGNDIKIMYNTAIDFVTGNPGDSHTDFVQTWVSSGHPAASANIVIKGNKATGPDNPTHQDHSIPSIHQCVMAEGLNDGGNSGGDGDPHNWLISDNYFQESWGQCIKLDGIKDVNITRNEFAGDSDHVIEVTSASSNVKFYSDNKITGKYGSTGISITNGSGPTSL